jgi:hypothetical protein
MKRKAKDRHLDTPSEASRDKHINFVAIESDDRDPADDNTEGPLADRNENDDDRNQSQKDRRTDNNTE